jgi:hypothetical protein
MAISVLLPAPFSPISPCTVPASTLRSTPSLARTAPKRLWMPLRATAFMVGEGGPGRLKKGGEDTKGWRAFFLGKLSYSGS